MRPRKEGQEKEYIALLMLHQENRVQSLVKAFLIVLFCHAEYVVLILCDFSKR